MILLSLESRLALAEEGRDALLEILAAAELALEVAFDVELLGRRYAQAPFRYQGKCYDALRKKFAALPEPSRRRLAPVLEEAGCLRDL